VAQGVEFTAGGLGLVPPYAALRGLTRWAAGLLAATAALSALSLGVELSQLRQLLRPVEGEAARALARAAQAATGSALDGLHLAVFAAGVASLLAWTYQARANVRALGVRRPRFSSAASVAAFLVPGLNLFRPYAVFSEIWRASDPAIVDPFGWRAARVPKLLGLWWGAVVTWALLTAVAAAADATAGLALGRLRTAAVAAILADLGACAAAAFTWAVLHRVSDAQQAKWELLRGSAGAGS
jgi:hypothetical protein